MKDLVVIGAGKFALEVTKYIDDVRLDGTPAYRVTSYLAVDAEPVHTPRDKTVALVDFDPSGDVAVVLGVSDAAARRDLIDSFIDRHALVAENIVHPHSRVDSVRVEGVGNIVGPNCYFGANVTLGSYNVLNYHCTIGHHSTLGDNNFIAPNFNCGNSVNIADDNFFGLSCTLAPEVSVGSGCRFQAGITLFEDAKSEYSYLVPSRIKSIKSSGG